MRQRNTMPVLSAVHRMVIGQDRLSVEALADRVGISASSLYSKLNPYDERQLNLRQFLILLDSLDPAPVLEALCERYGMRAVPAGCPVPDGHSLHEEMVHDHLAHAEFCRAIECGASPDETRALARKACQEIEETQAFHEREKYRPGPLVPGAEEVG
ncbi:hypothetical protein GGQ74_001167 [Desulfobaculum xiamenense]|uniref:Uncharacterized protein n=1 Tax=Desulfobaculum xiamenense TaxID=995050 RepID=A0A846QK71_9BACT|nr:phage regulatory CII family protein [Desulfobaculum xiamenense]NJB67527.1 hypothetical protein [Desulfobaculum xiamenense]